VNGASGGISVDGAGVGIGVVGGYAGEGLIPTPTTGIPPFTDPLITVPAPSHSATCISQTGTQLHPNVYCNGLHFTTGAYTLSAGTYVLLGGGLSIASTAQVTGNGVIFYATSDASHPYGGVNIGGSSSTNLSAPTTGTYAGILFFQDRSVPLGSAVSTFDESSGASFTGALYFPTTKVQFKGIPGQASFNPIDSWQIEFQGAATIKDNFLAGGGSPIPGAVLVE